MKTIVITILGKDQPGLVDNLAKHVFAHKGNWLASNFAQMSGQFAGFVEVHVPHDTHDALINSLNTIEDIHVQSVSAIEKTSPMPQQSMVINVLGNDKAGIVQELTAVLNQQKLNIRSMESCCESAPNWGSLMFKATIVIDVPEEFDGDDLIEALEAVANDLVVDISTYT
ncbi:glycine cleavage system protein R [Alteromonas sp. 5E99-2]|uniref:glycine cleavage system protein R n=1 Tax=Alteromonas sp. 5E99-2 TaxID=2817683 RepID=UPI001A9943DB|nr:ACT domain-containing protein [Alteromonas sp. 5E99-2]MBO1254259.1 glycine cleavage system protein R [Alteromonas sp. 5E99-2]